MGFTIWVTYIVLRFKGSNWNVPYYYQSQQYTSTVFNFTKHAGPDFWGGEHICLGQSRNQHIVLLIQVNQKEQRVSVHWVLDSNYCD